MNKVSRICKVLSIFLLVFNVITWTFFITSRAKASADLLQVRNSVEQGIPYTPIKNDDLVSKVYMHFLGGIYQKGSYDLSASLEADGYWDARPWYQIEDEEYLQWRYDNQPIYGDTSLAPECPLPVTMMYGYNYDDYKYVLRCIDTMPKEFVQRMADDGWSVMLTPDYIPSEMAEQYENRVAIGQTRYKEKTIYLSNEDLSETVYHEFGHVLALYADEELKEAGLKDFGNEELANMCCHSAMGSLYIYLTPDEQLAESLYDYIWYPREMAEQAPKLYNIYDKVVHSEG